jgi:signal transduction histidine kinase
MLGFHAAEWLDEPILGVLDARVDGLGAMMRRSGRRGTPVRWFEARRAGGGEKWLGVRTTAAERDGGAWVTAVLQDVTDGKRAETLHVRAERLGAVAALSASMAHEIKNPLASIRSAVEQLAGAPKASEDERVLGKLIVRESDRLSRLLSEFLDFARVRVTRLGPVDLAAVARSAATLAAAHPDCRADVEVQCVVPRGPLIVEGDEDLLHRVVFNIALNAVQASPIRGVVRIEVTRLAADQVPPGTPFERDAVALRIVDTGPGNREDIRDRIFDPFVTTKSGGTGLGLPIVHRAIDALRGVVLVESGVTGTAFTVLLQHADTMNGDPS